MRELEHSLQSDGWIGAITTAADGEVFDGSARLEVAALAEMTDAITVHTDGTRPVVIIRDDIPTTDDPRAARLAIAANRIAELNLDIDPAVLSGLMSDGVDLGTLYAEHELAALLAHDTASVVESPDSFPAFDESIPTEHRCPSCGYSWSGKSS
jgi:hypothetical protein